MGLSVEEILKLKIGVSASTIPDLPPHAKSVHLLRGEVYVNEGTRWQQVAAGPGYGDRRRVEEDIAKGVPPQGIVPHPAYVEEQRAPLVRTRGGRKRAASGGRKGAHASQSQDPTHEDMDRVFWSSEVSMHGRPNTR